MPPVSKITIVYDPACGLCTRVKDWMLQQTAMVALDFAASGSPETAARFPGLPSGELAVIANTGEVWLGNRAWMVCLWALRDYRDLAFRLTSALLHPLARQAFAAVSKNRAALSTLLRMRSEQELEQALSYVSAMKCESFAGSQISFIE